MSRQLCRCCLQPPTGNAEEQPYSVSLPEDGIKVETPLCMICIIFVGEEITRLVRRQAWCHKPIHQAIENVRASYERGRKTPPRYGPKEWRPKTKTKTKAIR